EQIVTRFFTEARAAKQLNHPNIVATYDFGVSTDGYLFISMEYLGGTTLSMELARKGRFSADKALMLTHGLADAVAHAHSFGVVHRDLKPENIILLNWDTEDGFVKVFDFGIAAILNGDSCARTERNEVLGTPAYMSPEQVKGDEIDSRSDLYSIGILLFEMLTGFLPFYGNDPYETMKKHLTDEAPALPAIDAPHGMISRINALLVELLRKDPAERLASASLLKEKTSEILNNPERDSHLFSFSLGQKKKEAPRFLPFHSKRTLDAARPVYHLNEQPTLLFSNRGAIHDMQTMISMSNHDSPTLISVQCGFCGTMNASILKNCVKCRNPLSRNGYRTNDTPSRPWTVSALAGIDIKVNSKDFTPVTLLHIELHVGNCNGETDNILRMLDPEIDAWSALVLSRRGIVCFNTGDEIRAVFGLHGN
ncbi:MAG: serine/threonine protein kinase, partial [Deltaproteobacteria bacterium]|nr:serine/threonine protein kinase [Deltaproteobacteria bacterium]